MALPLIYNWRNLFVRKSSTLLTFGVVAAIVFVLTWALAFGHGMRQSLQAGGSDLKLIVIKPGATGESTSIITQDEYNLLTQLPGLAVGPDGAVLRSGEICTQISLPRRNDPTHKQVPVAVRGLDSIAFQVHSTVKMTQGRRFRDGSDEIIVGEGAWERVLGVSLGDKVTLGYQGNRAYEVVGIFTAAGGPLESEIWGPLSSLRDAFGRPVLSSVALRAASPAEIPILLEKIKHPPYQLNAKTEREYYRDIADKSSQIVYLTLILVAFMAVGACFAVTNTIYAAVDARTREIAMLRTIGYSRAAIVTTFLIESLLLCCVACVVGAGLTFLFEGQKQDFMAEATWSTFAYEIRITPRILATSTTAALVVAFIGALVPAVRASRTHIVTALRQG